MTTVARQEIGQPSAVMHDALDWDSAPRDGWKPSVSGLMNAYRTIRQAVTGPASFIFALFLVHGHLAASRGWIDMFGTSSASDSFFAGFSLTGLMAVGALLTASAVWMALAVWELYKLLRQGSAVRSSTFTAGIALLATSVTMLGVANI